MSSRTDVRDLAVNSLKANEKKEISPCSRNDNIKCDYISEVR